MPRYFSAEMIYHNGQFCTESALVTDDEGYIMALLPHSCLGNATQVHDFGSRILSPGWIDLQVNGCGGGLFNRDLNLPCLEKMLHSSLRYGTTSIQPTLITCSDEEILQALELLRQAREKAQKAEQVCDVREQQLWQGIIGMHLEGPYISELRRGAHPARLIRALDETMLERLEAAGRSGVLSTITLAAESVSPPQVARLAACGVTVSLGHSAAALSDSRALLRAGGRCFTHLYNGMGDLDSREPHTLSLALSDERAYSSIIADGHHVAPENIRIARRMLGDRLFLVTDATATEDGGETSVYFGEQNCVIQDGAIRNEEGALAGSCLTMKRGVEILSQLFGRRAALEMAAANPMRALNPLNSRQRIGSFAPGSKANFVVLDFAREGRSGNWRISGLETWVLGRRWEE